MSSSNQHAQLKTSGSTPATGEPDNGQAPQQATERPQLSYKWEVIGGILGLLIINSVLFLPSYRGDHLDAPTMGVFGDFIGGYIGQMIAVVGLCVVIAGVRTEYSRSRRERFESRYFELLQLHRDNVEEMELQRAKGRKVFVLLLREWRIIINVVRRMAQDRDLRMSQLQLVHISYYFLFYGVGPNSSRLLKSSLSQLKKEVSDVDNFVNAVEQTLNDRSLKAEVKKARRLGYIPFEGHQSRLGHYYRHLFQMVKYVEANAPSDVSISEHMRTIRAQLSTHEQALLLLNSLTPIGAAWWNLNLIEGFKLVHNIPELFFNPLLELNTRLLFGEDYFEKPEKHRKQFDSLDEQFHKFDQFGEPIWHDGIPI